MNQLKQRIKQFAQDYHQEIVGHRRHIHMNPELSYQEVETGKYIAAQLAKMGIDAEVLDAMAVTNEHFRFAQG